MKGGGVHGRGGVSPLWRSAAAAAALTRTRCGGSAAGQRRPTAGLAVGETSVILLLPPLDSVGFSIGMKRESVRKMTVSPIARRAKHKLDPSGEVHLSPIGRQRRINPRQRGRDALHAA